MPGQPLDPASLTGLDRPAAGTPAAAVSLLAPALSLAEVAAFVLPMAAEHLRRVLRQHPDLPQGRGTGPKAREAGPEHRAFSPADLARLRAHFATAGLPGRWQVAGPPGGRAPVVVLTGPAGGLGRSVALCHLAVAAALSGRRVLAIDGDPWGNLGPALGTVAAADGGGGLTGLLARAEGARLARLNAARLDRGEPALAVDDSLAAARAAGPLRPLATAWVGLDLVPAGTGTEAALADLALGSWARMLPGSGGPGGLDLAGALGAEGVLARYDLILCDTPRGLGPLARAILGAADLLLAPVPPEGWARMQAGLGALGQALASERAEAAARARALGLAETAPRQPDLAILPVRLATGPAGAAALTRLSAAAGGSAGGPLAGRVLPAGLPEVAAVAEGLAPHLFAWGERAAGRARWGALRQAAWAGWQGLADRLAPG